MRSLLSHFQNALLCASVVLPLVACGANSSDSTNDSADQQKALESQEAQNFDSELAELDEIEEQVELEMDELTMEEAAAMNKDSVIAYTKKNKRIGERVGSPGGVVGLVPVDVNGLDEAEAAAVLQARKALAAHLELPNVDDAELVEISAQQWRNSSLGCARPGEMSAQVITDGYKVVLVLAGLRHQVHTGRRGGRVCERLQGMVQAPRRALTLSALPRLQQAAITDLAGQLDVAETEIRPGRVSPGSWADASMGCPEPGVEYAQVRTNGYFLPLIYNGRTVDYRTDGQRVVGCDGIEQLKAQDM